MREALPSLPPAATFYPLDFLCTWRVHGEESAVSAKCPVSATLGVSILLHSLTLGVSQFTTTLAEFFLSSCVKISFSSCCSCYDSAPTLSFLWYQNSWLLYYLSFLMCPRNIIILYITLLFLVIRVGVTLLPVFYILSRNWRPTFMTKILWDIEFFVDSFLLVFGLLQHLKDILTFLCLHLFLRGMSVVFRSLFPVCKICFAFACLLFFWLLSIFSLQFLYVDCFPMVVLELCPSLLLNVASSPESAPFSSLYCFYDIFCSNFSSVYKCYI